MKDKKLAIVIPAYKPDFLDKTLLSIAAQTNKNFNLYIGDDASAHDLHSIVSRYENSLSVTYRRFEQNLGGKDLVAQWNRCVDMTGGEEWVWMFSDDDIMGSNCVAAFYEQLQVYPDSDLFHFNVTIIDDQEKVIKQSTRFPGHIDIPDFQLRYWKSEISSYVVEYIFRRDRFREELGFEPFKFAWHTDEATWAKVGLAAGITTIENSNVFWRRSHVNITPDRQNESVVRGKLDADIAFAQWVKKFYSENKLPFTGTCRFYIAKRFVRQLCLFKAVLGKGEWKLLLKRELEILDFSYYYLFFIYYHFLVVFKRV